VSDVSRQQGGFIFKGQEIQLDFSTLKNEITMLSENIWHQSPSDVEPNPKGTETSTARMQ
jgi:hypothetical protein